MTMPAAGEAPPGMPAHLWEAAKRDVRGVIPDWLRSAKENGADAPPHIREVARRAARAGAGLGVAIAVGAAVEAAASTGTPTDSLAADDTPTTVDRSTEAVGLDELAAVPPDPAPAPLLAEAYRVPDPHEGWLTVEMYQDVVVNEGADAGYHMDAFQYLVIRDIVGREYVFKEHHHAALAEPPTGQTDLLIHERGQVHVVEHADGSFTMDTVGYDRSVHGTEDQRGAGERPPEDIAPEPVPFPDVRPEPFGVPDVGFTPDNVVPLHHAAGTPVPVRTAPPLVDDAPSGPDPSGPDPSGPDPSGADLPDGLALDALPHPPDLDPADPPDPSAFV